MSTTTETGFSGPDFEMPILEIEAEIRAIEQSGEVSSAVEGRLKHLRRQWTETTRSIYAGLNPWQIVQISRHKDRPYTRDYLNLAFDEFVELHGDRFFGDDRAMLTGFCQARSTQSDGKLVTRKAAPTKSVLLAILDALILKAIARRW